MKDVNPRHRFDAIRTQKRAPESDLERSLYVTLHGAEALNKAVPLRPWPKDCLVDSAIKYPLEILASDTVRDVFEAFLMASEDDGAVSKALGMDAVEVGAYRHLFFDTAVFRTDLERIVYLRKIPDENPNKNLYRIGFHQGFEALQWHFCRTKPSMEPADIVRNMMADTYFRALEHRGLPLTNAVAREAIKLARVSIDCARTLMNSTSMSDDDLEALKIQFEQVKQNRTIEDLGDTEVLH